MSIEIRPTAVTSQIEEKARILRAARNSLDQVEVALNEFASSEDSLKGAGYDAARAHMGEYSVLIETVRRSIDTTLDADGVVRRALDAFGGAGRVSEEEWRQKLNEAEQQISSLRAQANSLVQSTSPVAAGLECELMSINGSIQAWRRQANEAGRMLSRIYSYCEETNGAHEGKVEQINAMAAAGAVQFAGCKFSVSGGAVSWSVIDHSAWFNREVYDSCMPLIDRVYGDVSSVVLDNPVADSIANWWSENGTTVKNVGKIAFGVIGVAAGVAMVMSGVGAPAGIAALAYIGGTIGATYGFLDAASGLAGLGSGSECDWESDLAHVAATATGADANAVEAGINGFGTVVNLVNVAKLPANVGRLLDSSKDLYGLLKTTKVGESATPGVVSSGAVRTPLTVVSGEAALKKKVAQDAIDLVGDLEDPFDLVTSVSDGLTAAKNKERSYDAYRANVALGHGL